MHEYNKSSLMREFYDSPGSSGQKRLEYIYNKVYGVIPTMVNFTDAFERGCLDEIEQNFDVFTSDITVIGDRFIDESVWVGKTKEFENIFLLTSYRSVDGHRPFYEDLITSFSGRSDKKKLEDMHAQVKAACADKADIKPLYELLQRHKLNLKNKIYMMTSNFGEISLTPLPTMEVSNDLRLNYGDSFNEFHEKMLHSLKNETSGLYLFSGPPGTGKSSYIKYLTSCDVGRKIVYVPGAMIEKLVAPELVPILLENRDIILVLEDAEKALISREVSAHTDMVQTILNLTSGFLGDAANVSIIATFNTDKENIDEALLRKGRLKLSYEFDKLSLEDTLRLAESLGKNCEGITEGMSLADIYYIEKQSGYKKTEEKRVGFF